MNLKSLHAIHLTANECVSDDVAGFAQQLLESDRLYFEAGSEIEYDSGAMIVWMPNLQHIAAGCVVQRITDRRVGESWQIWLQHIEQKLQNLGCISSRLYLETPLPELEQVLKENGYLPQVEVGLLDTSLCSTQLAAGRILELRPVLTEQDWQRKMDLHRITQMGPDGHITAAEDWVTLERRKFETGAMRVYLAYIEGEVCGTVGALEVGELLRLKNLVIHPDYRRRGMGQATVEALRQEAILLEKEAFGCFALLNGAGQRVYERAGLKLATQQIEWYKPELL